MAVSSYATSLVNHAKPMNSETTQCWLHPSATLHQLLDDSTGTVLQAKDLLTCSETRALRIKKALQCSRLSSRGRILCGLCGVPVYLSGLANSRQFVFKHFVENGSCPGSTPKPRTVVKGWKTSNPAWRSFVASSGCGTARRIRTHRPLPHRVSGTSYGRSVRA